MQRILRGMVRTASALLLASTTAHAQCDFNGIAKAKGAKASMVRAMVPCGSTLTGGTPLPTSTSGGIPACTAVAGSWWESEYLLDRGKGSCSVATKVRVVANCATVKASDGSSIPGVASDPCHLVAVEAECRGVTHLNGTPVHGDADGGWSLVFVARITLDDPSGGDVTLIDLPLSFAFPDPDGGRLKLRGNSVEALADLLGADDAALPPCTQIEVLSMRILDPEGVAFATLGVSTLPRN